MWLLLALLTTALAQVQQLDAKNFPERLRNS